MEEKKKEEPDLDKDLIINGEYKIQYKLGKGGFSKVYLVQNINDGKNYALKVLLQSNNTERNKRNFKKEINILKGLYKLNNSYTLKVYNEGNFFTEDKVERLYYVMNYAEKGDLVIYTKVNDGLGEKFGKILFKKILKGIQFCHEHNVCHFDIKVENILLNDKFEPIINDFGISQMIIKPDTFELIEYKGRRGTENMMCPQMFEKGKTYNGIDADIFGLGVLLLNLVKGKCFKNANDDSYQSIKDNINEEKLSDEFKKLFVRMVAYEPKERPKINDILKDPWLNELNEKSPEEYEKLETDYIDFMTELEEKIKTKNHMEIEAQNKGEGGEGEVKPINKSISFNAEKKYFVNLKPKKIKDKRNYKYCIIIKGYINENDFMNSLVDEIDKTYKKKCHLNTSEEKLKFNITFIKEYDEDENDNNEEEEEDEDNSRECIMKVKLYDSGMNEYLLGFEKIQGDLVEFYENFLKIKEIIKTMFN